MNDNPNWGDYTKKTNNSKKGRKRNNANKSPSHPNTLNISGMDDFELTQFLCSFLEKEDFDIDKSISILKSLKNKRLIYSDISNHLFSQAQNENGNAKDGIAVFVSNVDTLKETVLSSDNSDYTDIKSIVLKLYDHTQLANHQVNVFKVGQEQFDIHLKNSAVIIEHKEQLANTLKDTLDSLDSSVDNRIQSVTSQVVSLVALFTAMSFLVFGGLSSFESIFSSIQNTSILKLIILSSVWGFAVLNTIAIFMFFTSRVVGKSFKVSENANTLFRQYPYIVLCNYILLAIFLLSSWFYLYVKKIGYHIPEPIFQRSSCFFVISFLIIVLILAVLGWYLFSKKIVVKQENSPE